MLNPETSDPDYLDKIFALYAHFYENERINCWLLRRTELKSHMYDGTHKSFSIFPNNITLPISIASLTLDIMLS
jgi:hypothetical protein